MAHTRDGAGRGCARYFDWLATLARIFTRDQKIWFSFPDHINVGSGRGAIRGAALYLRNARFFAHRAPDCGALKHRNGSLSNRTCAALDPAATRFANRNAGGDSKRHPWVVGYFRNDPVAARVSVPTAQALPGVDSVFHRPDVRPQYACRWNHHRHHDSADRHLILPGDSPQRSAFTARTGLRSWTDSLGSDANRRAELRKKRVVRCCHSRSGPRARGKPWQSRW